MKTLGMKYGTKKVQINPIRPGRGRGGGGLTGRMTKLTAVNQKPLTL